MSLVVVRMIMAVVMAFMTMLVVLMVLVMMIMWLMAGVGDTEEGRQCQQTDDEHRRSDIDRSILVRHDKSFLGANILRIDDMMHARNGCIYRRSSGS